MKTVTIFYLLLILVFAASSQAQTNFYPNELKGYEFFGKGKLSNLKPGISTREDVKSILGETCESVCTYDENWTVDFSYFENNWIKTDTDSKGVRTVLYLDEKYLGKLRKIEFRPKRQISFANISFPNEFRKLSRSEITKNPQKTITEMVTYDIFQDSHGLTYEIFSAKDIDNSKTGEKAEYKKGNLRLIRYEISKIREKEMFHPSKNK